MDPTLAPFLSPFVRECCEAAPLEEYLTYNCPGNTNLRSAFHRWRDLNGYFQLPDLPIHGTKEVKEIFASILGSPLVQDTKFKKHDKMKSGIYYRPLEHEHKGE